MSDFTHSLWSVFIAATTVIGIVACLLLLIFSGKAKASTLPDNTTGHVWDGDLREMNNPLPMWWVGLFVLTLVFGGLYLWLYPGLGSSAGSKGWTQQNQYEAEVAKGNEQAAPLYARFAAMPVPDIAKDGQARAMGERLFLNNCAQCHGSDAGGFKGFPNLRDQDWLWGGEPDRIVETITKGRAGQMPPMAAAVGGSDDVKNVAQYVLSLSGSPHDSVRAALGKSKFGACAACHGPTGGGNVAMGAPNLSDKTWLHGYGEEAIMAMVHKGKSNVMPAQEGRLTPEQIRVLAAYVWGLSHP